jgi:hypothetical protein
VVFETELEASQYLRSFVVPIAWETTPPEGVGDEVHCFVGHADTISSVVFRRGRYIVNVGAHESKDAVASKNAVTAARIVDNAVKRALSNAVGE